MALEPLKIDIEVNKANFEKQLKGAEQFARDTKVKINQDMKLQLEFNIVAFQNRLKEVKEQLKTATWDKKINLQIEANQLQRWLTEAKRNLNNLVNTWDTATSRLQMKFNQLWKGINNTFSKVWWYLAWVFSIAKVSQFFKWTVEEAIAWERAIAQLWAVIKSTWWSAWLTAKEVKNMATELSNLNGIEDDVIMTGQNMLLTFTNISKDVFKETTQATIDMATAMNSWLSPSAEQLKTTAMQLWKALNDPLKWVTKLQKVWVTFTETQKEQIKNFVEMWDVVSAQKIILAELNKEFWGSAQAQLETYAWKVQQLNVQRSNFKETIGNAVIPALTSLLANIWPMVNWLQSFLEKIWLLKKSLDETSPKYEELSKQLEQQKQKHWELNLKIQETKQQYDNLEITREEYLQRTKELWEQDDAVVAKIDELNISLWNEKTAITATAEEHAKLIQQKKMLEEQYAQWLITEQEYTNWLDKLYQKTKDVVFETDNYITAIDLYNQTSLDTSANIEQLEAYRQQALQTINAQQKLLELMNNIWNISWVWTWFWWIEAIRWIANKQLEVAKQEIVNNKTTNIYWTFSWWIWLESLSRTLSK